MEDMNFSQQETLQRDYDQFFEFVEDSLPTIDIWSNQNYELKAKTLREKKLSYHQ